jgi:hypothetical protein
MGKYTIRALEKCGSTGTGRGQDGTVWWAMGAAMQVWHMVVMLQQISTVTSLGESNEYTIIP